MPAQIQIGGQTLLDEPTYMQAPGLRALGNPASRSGLFLTFLRPFQRMVRKRDRRRGT